MNVDVREYLRINPISVHELTLSGDGRDCFLYFPQNDTSISSNSTGYVVHTQKTMFWSLYKAIFEDLVVGNEDSLKLNATVTYDEVNELPIITWSDTIHLKDTQFKNYVRRHKCTTTWDAYYIWDYTESGVLKGFKNLYTKDIKKLENDIDKQIFNLKKNAKLFYPGAVELQSNLVKKKDWKIPEWGKPRASQADADPIYSTLPCQNGMIWCYERGKDVQGGKDLVELSEEGGSTGTKILKHDHKNTKAEAMTIPFTTNKGGSKLVGKYSIGSKHLVAQDDGFGPTGGEKFTPIGSPASGTLTYPLWGQNVLDWRTTDRTHNNIPPVTNVVIRYQKYADSLVSQLAQRPGALQPEPENPAEPVYESSLVPGLDDFKEQNLTSHDYLLRMSVDMESPDNDVKLYKQTVQMLLDIFAEDGKQRLGVADVRDETKNPGEYWTDEYNNYVRNLRYFTTMSQILKVKLDVELVTKDEFFAWYNEQLEILDRIEKKMAELKALLVSVPPLNYTGRIIISATDDTEQKVIKHYGGKRWRRIMNFLRGVAATDGNLGKKLGEEYVCLRESNVPIHTHEAKLSSNGTTGPAEWLVKGKGGEDTKILNETKSADVSPAGVFNVDNKQTQYQLSPLEYQVENRITYPHDNMPPFKEVYIWECYESTEDERAVSGEPEVRYCRVVWNRNGGTFTTSGEDGIRYIQFGNTIGDPPGVTRKGHTLVGWYNEDGQVVTPTTLVLDDMTVHAVWKANEYTVTFHSNGGQFNETDADAITRTYTYGQELGNFPLVEYHNDPSEWSDETDLDAWKDSTAREYTESSKVENNLELYAQWKRYILYKNMGGVILDANNVASGFADNKCLETLQKLNFRNTFTIVLKFTTGDSFITPTGGPMEQQLFSTSNDIEVAVSDNKNNGTGIPKMCWEIACPWRDTGGWVTAQPWGKLTVQPNTTYWMKVVKYKYDNASTNNIFCYVKKENENWPETPDYQGSRDATTNNPIWFGVDNDGYFHSYWRGSIYMDESYIINDGIYHWLRPTDKNTIKFDSRGGTAVPDKEVTYGEEYGSLPMTQRTGYQFDGWWTTATGGTRISARTICSGDATYYAHWIANTYTINWYTGIGDTIVTTQSYGENLDVQPAPSNPGATFNGWFDSDETKATSSIIVRGNMEFYADWSGKTYTVTFDPNGGSIAAAYKTVNVPHGQTIPDFDSRPEPTRAGYTFQGWWTDPTGGQMLTSLTRITSNITYYAHWTGNKYTITLDSRGGELPEYKIVVTYGQTVGELPTPTKTAAVFLGWWTEVTGGAELKSTTTYNITRDRTYYAHWRVDVMVQLDTNYGSVSYPYNNPRWNVDGGHAPKIKKITSGQILDFLNPGIAAGEDYKIVDDGYDFKWWTWEGNEIKTNIPYDFQYSTILYAQYTPKNFTVTYHLNNSSEGYPDLTEAKWSDNKTDNKTKSVTYGRRYPTIETASATGWTFKCWYMQQSNTYLPDGKFQMNDIDCTYPGNHHYWAQWTRNNMTVTWNDNYGTPPKTETQTIPYKKNISPLPTRERDKWYDFNGWWTTATEGTGTQLTTATKITSNTTYYAHWTANPTWTVKFDLNCGSANFDDNDTTDPEYPSRRSRKVLQNERTLDDAPNAYDDNNDFLGWTLTRGGDDFIVTKKRAQNIAEGDEVVPATIFSGNTTVYGKWQDYKFKISFNLDGGTWTKSTTQWFNYGSEITVSPNPTKANWIFDGWNPALPATMPAEDISTTAKWKPDNITVTFYGNGGT